MFLFLAVVEISGIPSCGIKQDDARGDPIVPKKGGGGGGDISLVIIHNREVMIGWIIGF